MIFIYQTIKLRLVITTAYDPDGFIAQEWTKITGGFGAVVIAPTALATSFENLTEDYYTYKIEVTDNDGATASDLLNIIRIKDYILSLEIVNQSETSTSQEVSKVVKYKVTTTPKLFFLVRF
jgi:hypothetical protein